MKKLLLFLLIVISTFVNAQTPFQKTYGNSVATPGNSLLPTSDGGCILMSGHLFNSLWVVSLIKTDSNGDTLWTNNFNWNNVNPLIVVGSGIQSVSDGGYIITGGTVGGYDCGILKVDNIGKPLWVRNFTCASTAVSGWSENYSTKETTDGGYVFTGGTSIDNTVGWGAILVKTNSSGTLSWSKIYNTTYDEGKSVSQLLDGGYIICGNSSGIGKTFLIRTNSIGDTLWTKSYNIGMSNAMEVTSDKGYIITGNTGQGAGNGDIFLMKTNSNGIVSWTKTYGGTNYDNGLTVKETFEGGFVIGGVTNSFADTLGDIYIVKTNSSGGVLWSNTFGGGGYDTDISQGSGGGLLQGDFIGQTADSGYVILTASSSPNIVASSEKLYLIKTDAQGNGSCNQYPANTLTSSINVVDSAYNCQVSSGMNPYTLAIATDYRGLPENILCSTTNLQEISSDTYLLFPNPCSFQTTLQTNVPLHNATITVANCFGQTVKEIKNISGQTITFNRENLPSGLYFVRLAERNQIIPVEKLIITDK